MITLDETTIKKNLMGSLENLSARLIDSFSLRYRKEIINLSSPLFRWLDFRNRYISQKPRAIVHSDKFYKLDFPADTLAALKNLEKKFSEGNDVNPYQGRGLIKRHDTSGKNSDSRTDKLFSDWSILHFHLTNVPLNEKIYFSMPADYLLFCVVEEDIVAFIDVARHPNDDEGFSEPELINTIYRNWPGYLDQFKLNGITSGEEMTKKEISVLRKKGVNYTLSLDGKSYMNPGLGIMSGGISSKVYMDVMRIDRSLTFLSKIICDESNQFLKETKSLGVRSPEFSLEISERGLIVYESISKIDFVLPKYEVKSESNYLMWMNDKILPEWAMLHFYSKRVINI